MITFADGTTALFKPAQKGPAKRRKNVKGGRTRAEELRSPKGRKLEKPDQTPWEWHEGPVDRTSEHFELRYGEASGEWDKWISAALVGCSRPGAVNVEFLIDRADSRNAEIAKDVVHELDFYLVELRKPDPWGYLQYHCGTTSNVYSSVHWLFHPQSAKQD